MTDQHPGANTTFSKNCPAMATESVTAATPNRSPAERALIDSMRRMALVSADQQVRLSPLAGGVSSDIFRADLPSGAVCIKRALPKLRVAADWEAPIDRNRFEVEWMRVAASVVPNAVPAILGEDRPAGCFAMAYLAPDDHPVWKAAASRRDDRSGLRHARRDDTWPNPRGNGRSARDRGALSNRRDLPRDPARTVPRCHRACAS